MLPLFELLLVGVICWLFEAPEQCLDFDEDELKEKKIMLVVISSRTIYTARNLDRKMKRDIYFCLNPSHTSKLSEGILDLTWSSRTNWPLHSPV